MMSKVKDKNTKPEIIVRSLLHRQGFRFRLHDKFLPGKQDIVLKKYHAVVFVHGCYWHRHENCKLASTPKQNADFWNKKFDDNIRRDNEVYFQLKTLGWRVAIIWECSTRKKESINKQIDILSHWIKSDSEYLEIPSNNILFK